MERCPNCGARLDANPACRRCGMDLSGLLRVEQAAESLVLQGIERLASDPASAAEHFSRSLALRRTALARQLLGFARWAEDRPAGFVAPGDDGVPATTQPDSRS